MRNSEFHKLFVNELKGMYWLETKWITTLKELEEVATSDELKVTLQTHNLLNMEAITRLDRVFEMLEVSHFPTEYELITGLLPDVQRQVTSTGSESMVRDAALVISIQKVVHYTIASYGSLVTFARLMDHQEERKLLQRILDDKKIIDAELTALAENYINLKAVNE